MDIDCKNKEIRNTKKKIDFRRRRSKDEIRSPILNSEITGYSVPETYIVVKKPLEYGASKFKIGPGASSFFRLSIFLS